MVSILNERYEKLERDDLLGFEYLDQTNIPIGNNIFTIKQDRRIPETGGAVWDAAIVMSDYFFQHKSDFHNKRVLELGAGCGLCGIVLSFLGANVMITDTSDYMDIIQKNIDSNLEKGKHQACVYTYYWGEQPKTPIVAPYDILVGSDIIYNPEALDELFKAFQILGDTRTIIYLAHKTRFQAIEDNFFSKLKELFSIVKVGSAHANAYAPKEEVRIYRLTNLNLLKINKNSYLKKDLFSRIAQQRKKNQCFSENHDLFSRMIPQDMMDKFCKCKDYSSKSFLKEKEIIMINMKNNEDTTYNANERCRISNEKKHIDNQRNLADYISPGLKSVSISIHFPFISQCPPPPSVIPTHRWYHDIRYPTVGVLNQDEAAILYSTSRMFCGKRALEIGCHVGWSTVYIALAGVQLDTIDPMLNTDPQLLLSIVGSLRSAKVNRLVNLIPGASPIAVEELGMKMKEKWSLFFVDGNHNSPYPLKDAKICHKYAANDSLMLFHDCVFPSLAPALQFLEDNGWQIKLYKTQQIMGVAWRGAICPVNHVSDTNPAVPWWNTQNKSNISNISTCINSNVKISHLNSWSFFG